MAIKRSPEHLAAMRAGLDAAPKAGRYATHSRAKEWALAGPDGIEYRFRNLTLFVREHPDLFGTDVARVSQRLARLRPGHVHQSAEVDGWRWIGPGQGKSRPSKSYALRSPDGIEHRFHNMLRFVEGHADMFASDDLKPYRPNGQSRAALGLGQLRPKPGNRHKSWKGWTWLEDKGPASTSMGSLASKRS